MSQNYVLKQLTRASSSRKRVGEEIPHNILHKKHKQHATQHKPRRFHLKVMTIYPQVTVAGKWPVVIHVCRHPGISLWQWVKLSGKLLEFNWQIKLRQTSE